MVDLSDPSYEFLRDDRVFLMDLHEEDQVDPRIPWSFPGSRERDRLAGALRQLADVLASRHDLPIPKDGYARLDVIAKDGRRVAEIAHGPGGYQFRVLPAAFEQATDPPDAPGLAAADSPAASVAHLLDTPAAARKARRVPTARQGTRTRSRR